MRELTDFIVEKLNLSKAVRVLDNKEAKRFDILFDDMHFCPSDKISKSDGKPIAICVIEQNECGNDEPIWLRLSKTVAFLEWSRVEESIEMKSDSGYENTQNLKNQISEKDMDQYPAFNYVLQYQTTNTKKGNWFIGSEKEYQCIFADANIIPLFYTITALDKIYDTEFSNLGNIRVFWTSCSKSEPAATLYKISSGKGIGEWKDGKRAVMPLLKY